MGVYHLFWDLNHFDVFRQDLHEAPLWAGIRSLVMTLFLVVVGVSFRLSDANFEDPKYQARLKKVGICAFMISFITFLVNQEGWIYFGVLHLIFISSFIAPYVIQHPKVAATAGVLIALAPNLYTHLWFDRPLRNIAGLSPHRPYTEDFAPIMPWLGVVLMGIWIGAWVLERNPQFTKKEIPALSKLGRHSLLFYMTHQLVLYPTAWVISKIILD